MVVITISKNGTSMCTKEFPLPAGYSSQKMADFTQFIASKCGCGVDDILGIKLGAIGTGSQVEITCPSDVIDEDMLIVEVRSGYKDVPSGASMRSAAVPHTPEVQKTNNGSRGTDIKARNIAASNSTIQCFLQTCFNRHRVHPISMTKTDCSLAYISRQVLRHFAVPSNSIYLWIDPMKTPLISVDQLTDRSEIYISCTNHREIIIYYGAHKFSPSSIFIPSGALLSDIHASVAKLYDIPHTVEISLANVTTATRVTSEDINKLPSGSSLIATVHEAPSQHLQFIVNFGDFSATVQHPYPAQSQTKPEFLTSIHCAAIKALNLPQTLPVELQTSTGEMATKTSSFNGNLYLRSRRGEIFKFSVHEDSEFKYLLFSNPPSWEGLRNTIEEAVPRLKSTPYKLYVKGEFLSDFAMVKTGSHVIAYPVVEKRISVDSTASDSVVVSMRDKDPKSQQNDMRPVSAVSDDDLRKELAYFVGNDFLPSAPPMPCEDAHEEPSAMAEEDEGESFYCFPVPNEHGVFDADGDARDAMDTSTESSHHATRVGDTSSERTTHAPLSKSQTLPTSMPMASPGHTVSASQRTILPPLQAHSHPPADVPGARPFVPVQHNAPPPYAPPVPSSTTPQKSIPPQAPRSNVRNSTNPVKRVQSETPPISPDYAPLDEESSLSRHAPQLKHATHSTSASVEQSRIPFYATVKLFSFHEHSEQIMVEVRPDDSLSAVGKKCLSGFNIATDNECSFLAMLGNGVKAAITSVHNIFDLCNDQKATLLLRLDGNVAPVVLLRLHESDKPPHAMVVSLSWSWDTFLQHVRRVFNIFERTIKVTGIQDSVNYADVAALRDMDMLLVMTSNHATNKTPMKAAVVKLKSVTPRSPVKIVKSAEIKQEPAIESKVHSSAPKSDSVSAPVLTEWQLQIKSQIESFIGDNVTMPHLQHISERCEGLDDAVMMFLDTKDTFVAPAKSSASVPAVNESKQDSKPQPAPRQQSFEEQMLEFGYTLSDIRRARDAGVSELDSAVSFIEHMREEERAVIIPDALRPYKRDVVTTLMEMKYSTKNIEEALQRYSTLNECISYLTGEDQRECVLCREMHSQADMVLVGCCQHRYCYEMLTMYVQRALDGDHETPACIPACPDNRECNYLFVQGELDQFLEAACQRGLLQINDFQRLVRKMQSLYVAKAHHDNGHVRCVGCKGENDEGVWFSIPEGAAKGVTCPMCKTTFCLECKSTPYHYGCECAEVMQCAGNWLRWIEHDRNEYMQELSRHNQQFQQVLAEFNRKREAHAKEAEDAAARHRELEENEAWKAANCKVCPNCRRCINKLSGCDAMVCGSDAHGGNNQPGCGHRFSWSNAPAYVPMVGPRREMREFQEDIPQNAHEVHHELAPGIPRVCDNCKQAIVGLRIKCINCVEYNTCLQCSIEAPHNAQHTCAVIHENLYI